MNRVAAIMLLLMIALAAASAGQRSMAQRRFEVVGVSVGGSTLPTAIAYWSFDAATELLATNMVDSISGKSAVLYQAQAYASPYTVTRFGCRLPSPWGQSVLLATKSYKLLTAGVVDDGDFTLCAWISPLNYATEASGLLTIRGSDNNLFGFERGATEWEIVNGSSRLNVTITAESWQHYAYTYSAGRVVAYRNGAVVATLTNAPIQNPTNTWVNNDDYLFPDTGARAARAYFDEVKIYGTALTADEVQQVYASYTLPSSQSYYSAPAVTNGLVAHFDGSTADWGNVKFTSGVSTNTISSGTSPYLGPFVPSWLHGIGGRSLYIHEDTKTEDLKQSFGPQYAFGTNDWTILFFVKPTATGNAYLISSYDGDQDILIRDNNGQFNFFNSAASINRNFQATTNGVWHCIAVVSSNTTVKSYHNGVEKDSFSCDPNVTSSTMGIGNYSGSAAYPLRGYMDEVMFFNRALSGSEIATNSAWGFANLVQ